MELWYSEFHTGNVKLSVRINRQLFSGESEFQRIDVFESEEFGRFVALDGEIVFSDKDEFIYIIKRVLNGKKFYDSELLQYTIHNEKTNNEIDLTNREKCVLNYVCKGLSNKDIANELKVTDYTIKKHVSNILSKLHLRNRQDIILYVQDNNIIDDII